MTDRPVANFRTLSVTAQTVHALIEAKELDALALYMAYFEIADWQGTYRVRATTGFMAKRLGWGEDKIKRNKAVLRRMKLIADHKELDELTKRVKGHYVAIYHLVKDLPPENPPAENPPVWDGLGEEKSATSTHNVSLSTHNENIYINSIKENDTERGITKDYSAVPVDEDGNVIERKPKAAKPKYGVATFAVVRTFNSRVEALTGVKPLENAKDFHTIHSAAKRHEMTVHDFNELFDYFFNDSLSMEMKTSLQLACSDKYILKWQTWRNNRPITQLEAAEGIRL